MEYLSNLIKNIPVTCFFSSEEYGKYVAEYLNIENVVVDIDRKNVPICASKIRENLENSKEYIDNDVYMSLKV